MYVCMCVLLFVGVFVCVRLIVCLSTCMVGRVFCFLCVCHCEQRDAFRLMIVIMNADHGPWSDARWYQAGREYVHAYMAVANENCELFLFLIGKILHGMGWDDRLSEEGIEATVFATIADAFMHKWRKVATSRWFGFSDSLQSLVMAPQALGIPLHGPVIGDVF